MNQTCLKCGYAHRLEQLLPESACPQCGAVYLKVKRATENDRQIQAGIQHSRSAQAESGDPGTKRYLPAMLFICCLVLALSTAVFATLYYQQSRLNEILLDQREIEPQVRIANAAPPVAATPEATAPRVDPSTATPPASLAEDAEIIVISGYEAADQASHGTVVRVLIDRPDKSVLLVLTSYDKIAWHVDASSGTRIKGIVVSAYEQPRLYTALAAPVFQSKLPYSYEKDSGNFTELLNGLNRLFGTTQVDAYRGGYALPNSILVNAPDPPDSGLSLEGDQPQAPYRPLDFGLKTGNFEMARWTLEGPADRSTGTELGWEKAVKATQDQRIYRIVGHDLQVTDPATGKTVQMELPDTFPSLSWPMDVAYDSRRHLVALASLGGEGFFYRFDTRTGEWLDFRSMNNIDISSLAYDEIADRYVAWTSWGSLFFATGDGAPLYTKDLADRLPGFNRLYDTGNARPPRLIVIPRGDQIALIKPEDRSVGLIWYYDEQLDLVQLTYRQPARPDRPQ